MLYFKSSPKSLHMQLLLGKPAAAVSGTILPDRLRILAVQGIQFHGTWLPKDHPLVRGASEKYHLKYPFALAIPGEVSAVRFLEVKMARKRPGGKK
jgi:uncharacterized protein YhbP (UPF0306 family)